MTDDIYLTAAERTHLARRREADGPRRSTIMRIRTSRDRYLTAVSTVATALCNATAAAPPQPSPRAGRGSPGVSDPTGTQVHATWQTVERARATFAHLLGPCHDVDHDCPESLASVADPMGVDTSWTASHVLELLSSAPWDLRTVKQAALVHAIAVRQLVDAWEALQGHTSPDTLTKRVDELDGLVRRMRALGTSLGQWAPNETAQPKLLYCSCGELVGKYRDLKQCDGCYNREYHQSRKDGAA